MAKDLKAPVKKLEKTAPAPKLNASYQSNRLDVSQSLMNGLNEFSDALAARDDSFHCDRRTIWGDRISLRLIRTTSADRL